MTKCLLSIAGEGVKEKKEVTTPKKLLDYLNKNKLRDSSGRSVFGHQLSFSYLRGYTTGKRVVVRELYIYNDKQAASQEIEACQSLG